MYYIFSVPLEEINLDLFEKATVEFVQSNDSDLPNTYHKMGATAVPTVGWVVFLAFQMIWKDRKPQSFAIWIGKV